MTVFSVLRNVQNIWTKATITNAIRNAGQPGRMITTGTPKLGGGHERTMVILPSKWQWQKYKDQLHFYLFLGFIPCFAIVFYVNVFIGPATLSEIPCDYVPKPWEYYRHPISRWLAQWRCTDPQESYERNLHYIKEMDEERRLKRLSRKIETLMKERGDYPNFYTSKVNSGKYIRARVLDNEKTESIRGVD